jgi:uroporphyrinogen decarboxylase
MDAYASLPAEVLGVDWRIDLPELARRYPQRAVQGNLEPAILAAGPEATRAAAQELLAAAPPVGHIVNLGHGILPQTPLESVAALVDVVHSEELR